MAAKSPVNLQIRNNLQILYGGGGIVILIVALTAILALTEMRKLAEARTALVTQNMARLMEQTYDGLIDTIDVTLQTSADEISRKISTGKVDRQLVAQFLVRQQERIPQLAYIRGANAKGELVFGSGINTPSVNISDRDYFIRLRDDPSAALFVGKPLVGRTNKKWVWSFARRINGPDGSFGGVIFATIYVEDIDRMLAKVTLNAGDVATLRDAELGVIARHVFQGANPIEPGDKKIALPFSEALKVNPVEGTYVSGGSSIDAIVRTQSYRRSEKYQYYVNVGISDAGSFELWRKQVWIVSILVSAFALITIVFSRLIGRAWQRQAKDIDALHEAQRIANLGHFSYDIQTDRWTSSEVLDDIFGINDDYPRDTTHWMNLVAPDYREQIQSFWRGAAEPSQPFECEFQIFRPIDEQMRWVRIIGRSTCNSVGVLVSLVGTIQDITSSKKAEEEISNLAFYDTLTHLPNRRLVMDRLRLALSVSARTMRYGCLLFLDLDHFKTINDSFGHECGDLLLTEVAVRIRKCVREIDTVARLGGDEFLILLEEIDESAEVASQKTALIAEKIRVTLAEPYLIGGIEHRSSSSIGVSLYCGSQESLDTLLRHADMAMYQAKASGRNVTRFFDAAMQLAVDARTTLETDLHRAISDNQLQLYYQIQVNEHAQAIGAEALLRWFHPKRGSISPAQFIPIAEESALIIDLGNWVLNTAGRQLATWAQTGLTSDLTLAVNVSARQFKQQNFVDAVTKLLEINRFEPSRLKLELTESVVMEDVDEVVAKMHKLKELGIRLSMDDFGTGYSSLSYLKKLPLDQIKIDQSFVRDIAFDVNDAMLVKTIIDMAENFRLNVIAEGVESDDQLTFLKQNGCRAFQGYFFGKAVPIEELQALLTQSYQTKDE